MTGRLFILCFGLLYIRSADGYWVRPQVRLVHPQLYSATDGWIVDTDLDNEILQAIDFRGGDVPCWQNLLDDDCSMGNIYAANFVASKWIQSMPCGEGIEV
jgi:hypothetical protein